MGRRQNHRAARAGLQVAGGQPRGGGRDEHARDNFTGCKREMRGAVVAIQVGERDAALAGLGLALLPGYPADPTIEAGRLAQIPNGYAKTGARPQAAYQHRRHPGLQQRPHRTTRGQELRPGNGRCRSSQ